MTNPNDTSLDAALDEFSVDSPEGWLPFRDRDGVDVTPIWKPQAIERFKETGYPGELNYISENLGVSRGQATPEQKGPLIDIAVAEIQEKNLSENGSIPEDVQTGLADMKAALMQEDLFEIWDGETLLGVMDIDGTIANVSNRTEIIVKLGCIYVHPEYRGQDVGKALMDTVGHDWYCTAMDIVSREDGGPYQHSIHLMVKHYDGQIVIEPGLWERLYFGSFSADMLYDDAELSNNGLEMFKHLDIEDCNFDMTV